MPITTIADMQIVPSKFTAYTLQKTTEKSTLVNSGLFSTNPMISSLINGNPMGGNRIIMPHWKPLTGDDEVFGEGELTESKIETGNEAAAMLIRGKMWGDTDLSYVFGRADPMGAIVNLVADWWVEREQAIVLAILKGLTDKTAGALKDHVNDISGGTGAAGVISDVATLETKQTMGDAYNKLGFAFMHSVTYTELQKQQKIVTTYDPTRNVNIKTYMGYDVVVDDGLPVNNGVYDTLFIGKGAFARADGSPAGLVTYETDRKKSASKNFLINRRAMIIHPLGVSWVNNGVLTDAATKYAANVDLAKPENWKLVVDHKNVPITVLRHKVSGLNATSFSIPRVTKSEPHQPAGEPESPATPPPSDGKVKAEGK